MILMILNQKKVDAHNESTKKFIKKGLKAQLKRKAC